jgi:hypothetical protein
MEHLIGKRYSNHLKEKGIQPIIKTLSNANTKAKGSPARAKAVREMRDLGYQSSWRQKYSYGRHWISESTFSAAKKEYLKSMLSLSKLKIWFRRLS